MFDLPSNFTTQVASTSGSVLSSLSQPIVLIVGTLLAIIVVEVIIHALRKS